MSNQVDILLVMQLLCQGDRENLKQKTIDGGGSGMFKAVAVKETGLPDFAHDR